MANTEITCSFYLFVIPKEKKWISKNAAQCGKSKYYIYGGEGLLCTVSAKILLVFKLALLLKEEIKSTPKNKAQSIDGMLLSFTKNLGYKSHDLEVRGKIHSAPYPRKYWSFPQKLFWIGNIYTVQNFKFQKSPFHPCLPVHRLPSPEVTDVASFFLCFSPLLPL